MRDARLLFFYYLFDVEKDVTTTKTGNLTGNLDKSKNAK